MVESLGVAAPGLSFCPDCSRYCIQAVRATSVAFMANDTAFEYLRTYSRASTPLEDAAELAEAAQELLTARVVAARLKGVTWDKIGDALGITRQGAMRRYRDAAERFGQLPLEN